MIRVFHVSAVAFAGFVVGCSGDPRRELSGAVTYDGKPVPNGVMVFEPDTARGGAGPGATVQVRDGRYQTESGHGVVGGPHLIRAIGYTSEPDPKGEAGMFRPLFPESVVAVDIPPGGGTFDVAIPAKK